MLFISMITEVMSDRVFISKVQLSQLLLDAIFGHMANGKDVIRTTIAHLQTCGGMSYSVRILT